MKSQIHKLLAGMRGRQEENSLLAAGTAAAAALL